MNAFNMLYPWMVTILGFSAALVSVIGGGLTANAIINISRDPNNNPYGDYAGLVFGATAVIVASNLAAVVELAIVHWILG
jgi:hypothetical protein